MLRKRSNFVEIKSFVPATRAGVFTSVKKKYLGFRELGHKNRDLGNQASPASPVNTEILRRKQWRGEILETEPAQLTGPTHMKRP